MNRLQLLLIVCCVLFLSNVITAQSSSKEKISTLLELADSAQVNDIPQSNKYAAEALELANEAKAWSEKTQACIYLGRNYSVLKEIEKSEKYYTLALQEAQKHGLKKEEVTALIGCSGNAERQGEYLNSIEQLLKANQLASKLKDKKLEADINANIARTYYIYGDMPKAIEFLKLATAIYEADNNSVALSPMYNNLAILYKENNQPKEATKTFKEALRLAKELNDEMGMGQTYNNLGHLSLIDNQMDSAEFYLLEALQLFQKLNFKSPSLYGTLGELYFKKEALQKAEDYTLKSLELHETSKMKNEIMQNSELLSKIYALKGDYKKAYNYQTDAQTIKEALFKADKSREIELVENKYELQQKELEIVRLDKKNQRRNYLFIGLIGLLVGLSVVGFLFFRQRNLKNKEERIVLEQKLLRSQMNPHFIFNALSVIQSFIFKNKPKDAGKYLAKFSRLIRLILENSRKTYVPLDDEITALRHYLDLQQLRFYDKFEYEIEIDEEIIPEHIEVAPMLTQPFIENAIEHGIQHKEGKGFLNINFELKDEILYFILEDNGIGRVAAAELKNKKATHQSLSTQITKERLMIYAQRSKINYQLKIDDILDKNQIIVGTKVVIQVPFK